MKKQLLTSIFIILSVNSFAQDWSDWLDVGREIQVSFKFSKKGCKGYTYARIRNVSNTATFCNVTVSFLKICNNVKDGGASVSADKIGPGDERESQGNWYSLEKVSDIKLTKLTDKDCRDILANTPTRGGVNEIVFERKKTQQQINQEKEDEATAQKMKVWKEQEKQKQEQLKKQNEAANLYKQQQLEKQQNAQQQKQQRDETLKRKIETDKKANEDLSTSLNKSIEDAFNIIKENLTKSQKEEEQENVTQSTPNSTSSSSSPKGMYDKGVYSQYTERDMNSAIYWYTKSANAGYAEAMSTLSDYYSNEETSNYDKAIGWWLLAYQNKYISYDGIDKILDAYDNNKYHPTDFSNIFSFYTIVINSNDLFNYLKQKGDHMWAINTYANFYTFGQGCKTDLKQAFALYKQNAIDGFVPSMIALGLFYKEGYGTPKNYKEAITWLTKVIDISAPSRSSSAMVALGDMYKDGLGVEKSLEKAKEWYQKSYNAGYGGAKTKLEQLGN